jgi:hypothetical protein
MLHRTTPSPRPTPIPLRSLRVLVEDPGLTGTAVTVPGVEVTTCGGPRGEEQCPLVMSGACPLGPFDAVVSALDGPWATSVRRAWAAAGTPVVDGGGTAAAAPNARLRLHVGAALHELWGPGGE